MIIFKQMNKKIIITVVVVIFLAAGGWVLFTPKTNAPAVSDTTTNTNTQANSPEKINTPAKNVKSFNVSGVNFAFSPSQIQVKKGDTVRIAFKSTSGMHDFKVDEFQAATKVLRATDAEEVIEFVADRTGTFDYYCSVGSHRANGMVGKLVVTE
jgi:plastocyanin